VHGLAPRSTNLQMINCPLSGVTRAIWRILGFHTPKNISGTAKARVVKFCVLELVESGVDAIDSS